MVLALATSMKLWTIQTIDAWNVLQRTGVLRTDPKTIDDDMISAYRWMVARMRERLGRSPEGCQLPIWAWYQRMYENAVGQLTNLKGILRTADELLSQDKRLRSLMSNWGQVIRLSFRIKNHLTNLITGNLRAIANMAQRLRNGIFDPEADGRDFEEYLRYGIGRTAEDTESALERLKKMDNQFERLGYDHQIAADKAAQLQVYLEGKKEEWKRLKNCDDCTEKDRDIEHQLQDRLRANL